MLGKGYIYKGSKISPSQFLMIVVLRNGPMYGYEILRTLREEFSGLWEPQTGAIYPALKRLEEHGLLAVDNVEGKDYYRLTAEGEKWMLKTLGTISQEVNFLSRYIEILAKADLERETAEGREKRIMSSNIPLRLLHLVEDSPDDEHRKRSLKLVKAMLMKKVAEIDEEIKSMDKVKDR